MPIFTKRQELLGEKAESRRLGKKVQAEPELSLEENRSFQRMIEK